MFTREQNVITDQVLNNEYFQKLVKNATELRIKQLVKAEVIQPILIDDSDNELYWLINSYYWMQLSIVMSNGLKPYQDTAAN